MKYLVTLRKDRWTYDEDGDLMMLPVDEPMEMLKCDNEDVARAFAERLADIYAAAVFGEVKTVNQEGKYDIVDHHTVEGGYWDDQYVIVVEELPE